MIRTRAAVSEVIGMHTVLQCREARWHASCSSGCTVVSYYDVHTHTTENVAYELVPATRAAQADEDAGSRSIEHLRSMRNQ